METIDALGYSTCYEYDSEGRLSASVDALGRRETLYGDDGLGGRTVTAITDALGGDSILNATPWTA